MDLALPSPWALPSRIGESALETLSTAEFPDSPVRSTRSDCVIAACRFNAATVVSTAVQPWSVSSPLLAAERVEAEGLSWYRSERGWVFSLMAARERGSRPHVGLLRALARCSEIEQLRDRLRTACAAYLDPVPFELHTVVVAVPRATGSSFYAALVQRDILLTVRPLEIATLVGPHADLLRSCSVSGLSAEPLLREVGFHAATLRPGLPRVNTWQIANQTPAGDACRRAFIHAADTGRLFLKD